MAAISISVELEDVRGRRRRLGISQQRLATEAECSLSMVRLLEYGYQPAGSAALERVREVLASREAKLGL